MIAKQVRNRDAESERFRKQKDIMGQKLNRPNLIERVWKYGYRFNV